MRTFSGFKLLLENAVTLDRGCLFYEDNPKLQSAVQSKI